MESQNLLTWWDSLSYVDRRTRSAKQRVVSVLENAVLGVSSARTGGDSSSARSSSDRGDQQYHSGTSSASSTTDTRSDNFGSQ